MGPKHRRRIHVINLDPAAEHFRYEVAFDIRDLISVDDVMDELQLGPNGSLVYCMEYLLQNMDWLQEHLDAYDDDEYLIIDCPGQIELYTHIPVMSKIIDQWVGILQIISEILFVHLEFFLYRFISDHFVFAEIQLVSIFKIADLGIRW